MSAGLIVARVLHITLGAFWVGAVLFNTWFLLPAMQDAGPDGAKVGAALMRRGFMTIMPMVALVTILAGFWLYWKMSFGFQPEYMRSGRGVTYSIGALAAVVAFVIGVGIMRPALQKAAALAPSIAAASEAERPAIMGRMAALRARGARAGQVVAMLLVVATIAMSIGRYIG